ncbi:MAG TPA: Rrf2 family transcriptional regulator [Candidatus Sabulitectum sp.]|nr:Rrf2 family transcriptional regulator [Candidatus Sabulitectum sp.]HPF31958.1 Rrf2 family transcriptional regulator [Candidatus Sabulitectum sp.]HPJ29247.1 Rrf2 family transcriptional regulator [Candidatus Sabulitectum sp.]HPR23052.1 Rrf2 family transcriptional regulator [Candidatus Sabulitectum sp.]
MLISTRSRYGLRALTHLARSDRSSPVSLGGIAEIEEIPIRYLEQIFGRLRTADIVRGRRGPGGGYVLSRDPGEISLLDVIRVLETEFFQTNCALMCPDSTHTEEEKKKGCAREEHCPTRRLWSDIKVICESYLNNNTLVDLAHGSLEME